MSRKARFKKGYLPGNDVELLRGGSAYFNRLLTMINQARFSIHMQVYIFDADETGTAVAEALKTAARRGVKVYLMPDGYASQSLPAAFIKEFKESGVHFRFFEPLLKSTGFYFGRRMHHKIVVTDASESLVGGINIADRYNDTPKGKAWLDFALYVKGPVSKELCTLCNKQWKGYLGNKATTICNFPGTNGDEQPGKNTDVKICRNDWVNGRNQISVAYIEMLRTAQSHVIILCSYFLPGRIIRKQIIQALRRGVNITVITAGDSDIPIAKNAERWLYDYLLRNNVKLYEYQENVLHGKIAVCDGTSMTAGSYNINNISAYASVELNLVVKDAAFSLHTQQILEEIIHQQCKPITKETHSRSKNILTQLLRWTSYQLIRLIFYLFTFYFKQKA